MTTTGSGPRVVLVHGFTQTHRSWAPIARKLATDYEVVGVDAPGHGASPPARSSFAAGAAMIGGAGGKAVYVGYSMGGRYCLRLALDDPGKVRALVVLGASPGIADAKERAERRERDFALAATLDAGDSRTSESERLGAFIDRWLASPLFATLRVDVAGRDDRMAHNSPRRLAESLRNAGAGAMKPMWDDLHRLTMPVLVVCGENDTVYGAVCTRASRSIGANARLAFVPGAGHAAHLERPDAFTAIVRSFLADTTSRDRPDRKP